MSGKIDFETVSAFSAAASMLRRDFPEFAREIDRMHFEVGRRHVGNCGHGDCDCQMSFEDFHARRNRFFGRAGRQITR